MNYYYNGSVLIGITNGSTYQRFSYDANGRVVAVDYSTDGGITYTTYYYLRNAQGDIVKLIDGNGNTVVEYVYDSWGKKLSTTGTLAATLGANQPFRYRGYVYDEETGWYYLQSRYYDPTTGRFISADVYLSTGQGVLGHNAFAYCLNNPICRIDPAGSLSFADILQFFHNLLKGGGGGGGSGGGYGGGSGGVCSANNGDSKKHEETEQIRLRQNTNAADGSISWNSELSHESKWSASTFRKNLQKLTGLIGEGMDAHHVFPQHFEDDFWSLNIDIHDPQYGSWVEQHIHRSFSYEYNLEWQSFLDGNPTFEEVMDFARELAAKFGFDLWFGGR